MNLSDYQTWAATKAANDLTDREAKLTWALGLVDESIEVYEVFYGNPDNRAALLLELGDAAWYTAMLATAYQVEFDRRVFPGLRIEHAFVKPDTPTAIAGLLFSAKLLGEMAKKNVSHWHPISKPDFKNVIHIVLTMIESLAGHLGSTLTEVLRLNREKLDDRYKTNFTSAASINR